MSGHFPIRVHALLKLPGEKIHPIPANLCGAIAVCPPINFREQDFFVFCTQFSC